MRDLPQIPRPEVHLCVPEHLENPRYEDPDSNVDSRIVRNTLLALVLPVLAMVAVYFAIGLLIDAL